MNNLPRFLCFIFLGSAFVHADPNSAKANVGFQKIEQVLNAAKEPLSLQRALKDLGLIENWNKEEDAKLLIGIDGDWGDELRVYKAKGYKQIKRISLLGTPKEGTEFGDAQFDVKYVCISEKKRYHTFRWIDGRYKHTRTAEITKR